MLIRLTYSTIDRYRKAGVFKTLKGAQKFAHRWVGPHPEVSETFRYAVSADGVGKLTVDGVSFAELFPDHTGDDCHCRQETK
jgi:hypothetical protein